MSISNEILQNTYCYSTEPIALYATLHKPKEGTPKASILYFHGGGLLYGNRDDLPSYHLEKLCKEGYAILTFDYRLAPAAKINEILKDIHTAIEWFISNKLSLLNSNCPYFLWGRSAGAYLCLQSALTNFTENPRGIISYYGYTFLCNHWFNTPSAHYSQFPSVNIDLTLNTFNSNCVYAKLEDRYPLYVYARQSGKWLSLFYEGREKNFYKSYSFRLATDLKAFPHTFIAHGMKDTDVPFDESKELAKLLPNPTTFFISESTHDFDRYPDKYSTQALIDNTINFINSLIY